MPTTSHLNIFPLGSYNMLLVMDWLYLHNTKVDFFGKAIEFLDDIWEPRILRGEKKATSVRMVTAMQAKCGRKKGCVLFPIHISSEKCKEIEDAKVLSRYVVLK